MYNFSRDYIHRYFSLLSIHTFYYTIAFVTLIYREKFAA